ncbi:hypothetical protein GW750_09240 [bacterium]|nr:hypothetical protein [bacterium]
MIKDKQNRHIVCHIDAKRISQSKELTEQLQKTLQSRLQDFGEDTKDLKMYV